MHKYTIILVLLICSCTPAENAHITPILCPNCSEAYQGFSTCAFFDADTPSNTTLIDQQNYHQQGIPIHVRGYMHHKFCINDTHAVFGSANPTATGLTKNDNIVIRTNSRILRDNFAAEYHYLLRDASPSYTQKWKLNNRVAQQRFCPRSACESFLINQLTQATQSIVFLSFSFTSNPVADTLIDAHANGLCVAGLFDSLSAHSQYSVFSKLRTSGIQVAIAQSQGLFHHKAFIIDGKTAIVGSYNPSKSANTRNAETIVTLQEPAVVSALLQAYLSAGGVLSCE